MIGLEEAAVSKPVTYNAHEHRQGPAAAAQSPGLHLCHAQDGYVRAAALVEVCARKHAAGQPMCSQALPQRQRSYSLQAASAVGRLLPDVMHSCQSRHSCSKWQAWPLQHTKKVSIGNPFARPPGPAHYSMQTSRLLTGPTCAQP
jgi:hypothetical protein